MHVFAVFLLTLVSVHTVAPVADQGGHGRGRGTLARWHVGTLARWHVGTLARWHVGTLAGWRGGGLAGWRIGGLARWHVLRCWSATKTAGRGSRAGRESASGWTAFQTCSVS